MPRPTLHPAYGYPGPGYYSFGMPGWGWSFPSFDWGWAIPSFITR